MIPNISFNVRMMREKKKKTLKIKLRLRNVLQYFIKTSASGTSLSGWVSNGSSISARMVLDSRDADLEASNPDGIPDERVPEGV